MKSMRAITLELLLVTGLTVMGCSSEMSNRGDTGWITLLDGSNPKTLENWNRIGDANWRAEDGAIVADKGKGGHLISKNSYTDFQIRAEVWADHTTNSGIFFRISDPKQIGANGSANRRVGLSFLDNFCRAAPSKIVPRIWVTIKLVKLSLDTPLIWVN